MRVSWELEEHLTALEIVLGSEDRDHLRCFHQCSAVDLNELCDGITITGAHDADFRIGGVPAKGQKVSV